MAIIIGKIDSGKRLRLQLSQRGINSFNSLKDISEFEKDYKKSLDKIKHETLLKLEEEIFNLNEYIPLLKSQLNDSIKIEEKKLDLKILNLKIKCEELQKQPKYSIIRIFRYFKYLIVKSRQKNLEKNYHSIIDNSVKNLKISLDSEIHRQQHLTNNKESIFEERFSKNSFQITNKKKAINELRPLILGAIGETKVVREIEKNDNKNYLINDFNESFPKPLFNKQTKDYIKSIQVDHLLINNSGVFILETKNWSKKTIQNQDLRSPVEQIRRSNFALYNILNGNNSLLHFTHHWGQKKIPIRNVIVMTGEKPNEIFKYVAIKRLDELNRYLLAFNDVLTDQEVKEIVNYLNHEY